MKKNERIQVLDKEGEINKVLKEQRSTEEKLHILFVSPWDRTCNFLLEKLKASYNSHESLYVVDSFFMPHSFVIFNVTRVPCLVTLEKEVKIEDYTPFIYEILKVAS